MIKLFVEILLEGSEDDKNKGVNSSLSWLPIPPSVQGSEQNPSRITNEDLKLTTKKFVCTKKRYWRGFVMTKMTDAEYLVRLPDLGLIVQVKKWRLSNAFFIGPELELIKFFGLRKWCTLFEDNSLQQYKTMTIEHLKNLLYDIQRKPINFFTVRK